MTELWNRRAATFSRSGDEERAPPKTFQSRVKPPHSQSGKPGNFLVKNFQDRATAYFADVWTVNQTLLRQTYESVTPGV